MARRLPHPACCCGPTACSRAPAPSGGAIAQRVFETIQHDFAHATKVVFLAVAGVMAVSFLVAVTRMERGVPEEVAHAVDDKRAPESPSSLIGG